MDSPHTEKPVQSAGSWFLSGQISESEGVRKLAIPALPCEVGRRSDAPISLPCTSISKTHAEFFAIGSNLCLKDHGSTNGTFVNGVRLEPGGHSVLQEGDLIQFASLVFRLGAGRHLTEGCTMRDDACDRALAMMQFDRLMSDGGMVPFFQPIVDLHENCRTVGYEILGRSRLFGLKTPAEMFSAAAKLNLEAELSCTMRHYGIQLCEQLPPGLNIFVNTHPIELVRDGLRESLIEMRRLAPDLSITLEIHEAAVTSAQSIIDLRNLLADLNMQLAFDDFGVGRSRLVELSEVRPDFVKFDMKLTRDIHRAPGKRQEVVALVVKMVNDLGITSLAEGVEHPEADTILRQMNFRLGQGFYYGRPAAVETFTGHSPGGCHSAHTMRVADIQRDPR
jgi:EAL domain-containing protein (putative c-di-GMP-specific phosphodiesterase class I)